MGSEILVNAEVLSQSYIPEKLAQPLSRGLTKRIFIT